MVHLFFTIFEIANNIRVTIICEEQMLVPKMPLLLGNLENKKIIFEINRRKSNAI